MATPTRTVTNATGFELTDAQIPGLSLGEKLALTAALIGLFVGGVWLLRRLRRRVNTEGREREIGAVFTIVVVLLGVALASLIVSIWAVEISDISAFSFFPFDDPVTVGIQAIVTVFLVVGVSLFTAFVKDFIYDATQDTTTLTKHQTELLFRSTQVTLYLFAVLIVLSIWKVNLGGLLVGAGFLGIVLGLAAQQTLGSLIAGFVLMFARPFEIGDWVKVGDREGIVTEISIVNTRIQTFDGEYAMIPNDVVSSSEIINRTRKGRLRIRIDVGVDYTTDLDLAIDTATSAMRDVDEILTVPQPQVVLKEFNNSEITLELRFWIDKPSSRRRWRAQTAVVQAVKTAFNREGIKIPFPQRELMGRSEAGGFRLAESKTVADRSSGKPPHEGEQ